MANYNKPNYVYARPRYFDGEFLIDQDFADEQMYHMDRAWRHNRLLHVAGIAEGLQVSVADKNKPYVLAVTPGTAIDGLGRTIVLPDDSSRASADDTQAGRTLDVSTYTGKSGTLVLAYPVDAVQGMATSRVFGQQTRGTAGTETHYSEWGQLLFVEDGSVASPGAVTLAYLTVSGTGVGIDTASRQYSGLRLPSPVDDRAFTLRTIVNSTGASITQMSGNLSVSGNVGIGTTTPGYPLEVTGNSYLNGDVQITGASNYGSTNRQMLNLYSTLHGVGVQSYTTYFRTSTNFGWFKGGAHNDASLNPGSGGTLQMSILANGNVGLGTDSPGQKLQVDAGNMLVRGANNFAAAGNTAALYVGDTNHLLQSTYGTGLKLTIPTAESLGLGGSGKELTISGSTGDVQVVGKLGVGTASPSQKLQIDSGNLLVRGANNFGANGQTAIVYLGDTNHFIQSTYGTGVTIGTSGASTGIALAQTSGNVGIGTAPSYRLHVVGSSATDFFNLNTAASGMGQLEMTGWSSGWNIQVRTASKNLYLNRDADATSNVLIGRNGKELTINGSTGDVSLGTNINFGATTRQMLNLWNANYGIGVQSSTQYFRSDKNFAWYKGGAHSSTELDAGTGGTVQMVIKDGKVGIGTTTPRVALEVDGAIMPAAAPASATADQLKASGIFFPPDPGGGSGDSAWLRYYPRDSGEAMTLELGIANDAADHIALMPNAGNVGIGTNAPTAKLEVVGRIKDQTGYVMPVGSILPYMGSSAPDGWLLCDGATIPSDSKYQSLKDLIGSNTPNLKGRVVIGAGAATSGTTYTLKGTGGAETHTLATSEMPSHKHYGYGEADSSWLYGTSNPNGKKDYKGSGDSDNDNYLYGTSDTGGGGAHNNMQPYYVVNYIIKY